MLYFIKDLKNIRNENGLSQEKLAQLTGIGERTIKRIETGSTCNKNTVVKLCGILPEIANTVIEEASRGSIESKDTICLPVNKTHVPILSEKKLSNATVVRIEDIAQTFNEVFPSWTISEWVSDFAQEPTEWLEHELKIWESLSLAYKRFILKYPNCSYEQKKEAAVYLLHRSSCSKKQAQIYEPEILPKKSFKFLQSICRFRGAPIGVRKIAN